VTKSYPINCNHSADEGSRITVIGLESGSNCFSVKKDVKYLIAGNYIERKECGDKQWFATKIISGPDDRGTKRPTIALSTKSNRRKMAFASDNSCDTEIKS